MTRTLAKTCLYAGSFDPPTFGHMNIVERGLRIFDRIVIAVADNSVKSPLFEADERMELLRRLNASNRRVEVTGFKGLLVDYARRRGIRTLLRGIRTVADYEYELQMSLANRMLEPGIETVFVMTEGRYSHISSTIIKEIVRLGGSVRDMVPPLVQRALKGKFRAG